MELIVKILDEDYKYICKIAKDLKGRAVLPTDWKAIANGTPLPKGHGRLIDANDVDNHIIGSVDLRDCPTIVEADKENNNGTDN